VITEEQRKYEELRKELLIRLGEKDNKGELKVTKGIVHLGENNDEYSKLHLDLLDIEVELTAITLDELDGVSLSAADLISLGDLIAE
jgi:hypothetical protein